MEECKKNMVCLTPEQYNRVIMKLKCSPQDVNKAIEILDEIANVAKKNFFNDVKPSPDMEYKSAKLTKSIKEVKQFIEKNDAEGLWNFVIKGPGLNDLSDEEVQSFYSAVVTDKGTTVMEEFTDYDYISHEGLTD